MGQYTRHDIRQAMKHDPWIKDIASKPMADLTSEEIQRVVHEFICKHWMQLPFEVFPSDVAEVLETVQRL